MSANQSKGMFTVDAAAAAMLLLVAGLLGITTITMTADSLAWDASNEHSEATALRIADYLVKECEPPGLAECDSAFTYSHVLSSRKTGDLQNTSNALKNLLGNDRNFSIRILGDNGVIAETIPVKGVCVRRLSILEEKIVIVEVCSS